MNTVTVRSETNPSTSYTVTTAGGVAVACTCPSRTTLRKGQPCKHMRAADAAIVPAFDFAADAAAHRAAMAAERRLMLHCLWADLPWTG